MNFQKRIFTTLLAVIMLLGAFSGLGINVGAASEEEVSMEDKIKNTYLGQSYNTPEEKLASMTMMLERDGYQLWVDPLSGEVATKELATGNIAFSNPWDVTGSDMDIQNETKKTGSQSTQMQVLSQLVVQYVDNGTTKYLYSFEEAALREQISIVNIKNGVRIEYTIGREESRKLVPRWISEENFIKFIQTPLANAVTNGELSDFLYRKVVESFYFEKSLENEKTQRAKDQLLQNYPICAEMDIYEFAPDATSTEVNLVETYIKTYCEDYSFEQMDADHEETGYEATDEKYPVFKMALEYSFDNGGLIVRLPCNGLRYDMTTYTLENLSILPYFGAGNSKNPGYNFYPDGSGSLFDFEQLNTKATTTIKGKVYGSDYAYHTLTGTYQKAIRYPVYGTVATETIYSFTCVDADGKPHSISVSNTVMDLDEIKEWLDWEATWSYVNANGETVTEKKTKMMLTSEITEETYKRGYVAVIESGDSLAEIATYHAGSLSPYNTIMNYFNPKPKDSYDLADALSVTNNSIMTVVSDRKYTGNIRIRYQMLSDVARGQEARKSNPDYKFYEASWLGMAEAYRDYLVDKGILTKLEEDDVQPDIPLYMESFGALEVQKVIATIPMDVMTPLTTFENVSSMYEELSNEGVKNINFKLTGFANGGMYYTVPSALEWEDAVGGEDGFKELIEKSKEINSRGDGSHLGLFPDFDFAYIQANTSFDDTNLRDDAVKTIDNRYTSLRQYSATLQTYVSFYQLAVSPSRYSKFYKQLLKSYQEYGLDTMSVGSLGSALNSDFDEDDPYNREDNKEYTEQAFSYLKNAGYSLMTDKGNAYTWGYVDHIINVDLDSSRYVKSSASVPFIGAVLHGYIEFAGTPFNKEGDTDYAMLRAIENGSGLYFVLSYQNTAELKKDVFLSQHYSVQYDIWREDVIAYYNELNSLLKDVQTKEIIAHQFLEGERVLDRDELLNEIESSLKEAIKEELKKQEDLENSQIVAVGDAWQSALNATSDIEALIAQMNAKNDEMLATYNRVESLVTPMTGGAQQAFSSSLRAIWSAIDGDDSNGSMTLGEADIEKMQEMFPEALDAMQSYINTVKNQAAGVYKCYEEQKILLKKIYAVIENVEAASAVIENSDLSEDVKKNLVGHIAVCLDEAKAMIPGAEALVDVHVDLMDNTKSTSVINIALTAPDAVAAIDSKETEWSPFVSHLKDIYDGYEIDGVFYEGCTYFTAEDVLAAVRLDEEDVEDEEVEDSIFDRYHVDNNQIVAVTYGDRDFNTYGVKTAYKTFILNYNTFAVFVEYDNVKYTIPSGGYVVINH